MRHHATDEKHKGSNEPLHRTVFNYVQQLIASGKYDLTKKLPTDHQLMRQFGVSRATVGKAMRDLETKGLIERLPGVGSFAKPLAASQTVLLAVLIASLAIRNFTNRFVPQLPRRAVSKITVCSGVRQWTFIPTN